MTNEPWHITPTAVRELLAITGRPDTADERAAAAEELAAMAHQVAAGAQTGRTLDSGATQYRGPRPLRLRLTVAPSERAGGRPVLVRVQPDHEGRQGTYTRSAPERRTGHSLSGRQSAELDRRDVEAVRRPRPGGAPGTHAHPSYPLRAPIDEREAWDRAAAAAGLSLSEWIRDALRRAASTR